MLIRYPVNQHGSFFCAEKEGNGKLAAAGMLLAVGFLLTDEARRVIYPVGENKPRARTLQLLLHSFYSEWE